MQLCQYPCQSRIRRFTVEAIQIPIVYNRYGDYDPNGLLYVLEQDSRRIQEGRFRDFSRRRPSLMKKYSLWCCGQISEIP